MLAEHHKVTCLGSAVIKLVSLLADAIMLETRGLKSARCRKGAVADVVWAETVLTRPTAPAAVSAWPAADLAALRCRIVPARKCQA